MTNKPAKLTAERRWWLHADDDNEADNNTSDTQINKKLLSFCNALLSMQALIIYNLY